MRKIASIIVSFLLIVSLILVPPVVQGVDSIGFVPISAGIESGSITISWAEQSASTIYLYRDYVDGSKPIATLKPSDTSYTDKPAPGAHSYSLMVIGRDGRVAGRSSILPTYVPSECESPSGTVIKLWIGKKKMGVDCETEEIDTEPIIIQDNTFVSIRPIIEAVGGTLGWDGATKSVVVNLPPHSISLSIGKNTARVDGKEVKINDNPDIAPVIVNSRTMLPFRFIAENLEGDVSWNQAERRIDIVFPLQNTNVVKRVMSGLTSLGRSSLGQFAVLKDVSAIETSDPMQTFVDGAKVLVSDNGTPKAISLIEYTDNIGRPLKLTRLVEWLATNKINLKAYKVGFKSNMSNLKDFETVVLETSTGDIVDVTFLLAGFDFISLENNSNSIDYSIFMPQASIKNGIPSWTTSEIPMQALCKVSTIDLSSFPGCETCSRVVGNFEMTFENHPTKTLPQANNLALILLSSISDFSFDVTNDDGLNISLDEGCGFFPGTSCPDIEPQFTNIQFEMRDLRPPNNTSSYTNSSALLKGIFELSAGGVTSLDKSEGGKLASSDFVSLQIENSPRPRNITLSYKKNDHLFGNFIVFSLPKQIKPTPPSELKMEIPILNSPAGKQAGSFKVEGNAVLNVSFSHGKPAGWFHPDQKTETSYAVGTHKISGSKDFDCPCGLTKGIEFVDYNISHGEGVGKVEFDIRINPDIAFQPKNADVKLELVRSGNVLSTHDISISNPSLSISDLTAAPGEYYKYCLNLLVDGKETEQYCIPEEVQPNPWLFLMEWNDSPTDPEFSVDIMREAEEILVFTLKNISDSKFSSEIVLSSSSEKWGVHFMDESSPLWVEVSAGGEKEIKISVTPNSEVSSGEECLISLAATTGLQNRTLLATVTVTAPACSFNAGWEAGGTGIGNDVNAGTTDTKLFTITNTSNKQQDFYIDFETDQTSDNAGISWQVMFPDNRKGERIYLNPEETIIIPISVSPAVTVKEGEKIKIKVKIIGCGETRVLSWKITCKLMECSFELEWMQKSSTTKSTVETEAKWNETFRIWNYSDSQSAFLLNIENEGERIISFINNYEVAIDSNSFIDLIVTYQIPSQARIGDVAINIIVNCGKTTKTLTRRLGIKKKKDCQFITHWMGSNTDKLSIDMPVGRQVKLPIYIQNQSNSAQLFAVKVDRTKKDWMSGFDENKLKQTFTLNPGEETNNLVVWIEGGDDTKPGDSCIISVRLNACRTNEVLICKVVCVEDSELGVNFENKIAKLVWKRNGMLEVNNRITFSRTGVGLIKALKYKVDWYNADQNDAYLGGIEDIKNIINIFKDMPAWDMKYYIPTTILEKMEGFGNTKIKSKITMSFSLTDENEKIKTVTKEFSVIFDIPEK